MSRRPYGFSLIELVIVVAILSVLMSIFLDRAWYYQELAEKTSMEEEIGAFQSALNMQYGKHLLRNNSQQLVALQKQNPVNWLQKVPKNYAGEFYDPTPRSVAPGSWVFDLKNREMVYILDRTDHFTPGKDGKRWIRFRVRLQREAQIMNDQTTGESELVAAVFEPTERIRWF